MKKQEEQKIIKVPYSPISEPARAYRGVFAPTRIKNGPKRAYNGLKSAKSSVFGPIYICILSQKKRCGIGVPPHPLYGKNLPNSI